MMRDELVALALAEAKGDRDAAIQFLAALAAEAINDVSSGFVRAAPERTAPPKARPAPLDVK